MPPWLPGSVMTMPVVIAISSGPIGAVPCIAGNNFLRIAQASAAPSEWSHQSNHSIIALQHPRMILKADPGTLRQVPTLPRHLATPDLMERAGDPTFYDEPELARLSPPAARRMPSDFAPEGCLPPAALHVAVMFETLCSYLMQRWPL